MGSVETAGPEAHSGLMLTLQSLSSLRNVWNVKDTGPTGWMAPILSLLDSVTLSVFHLGPLGEVPMPLPQGGYGTKEDL